MNITYKENIKAVILGHAVADALGVPAEFRDREVLMQNPITDMIGYGTYNVPRGTWSDDTSMSIATLDSLVSNEIDYVEIMDNFVKNRLTAFANEYPELCRLVADDEMGCLTFEINKDNFTFRVMKPASDKKREKAREQMNKLRGKTEESSATISETKKIGRAHV